MRILFVDPNITEAITTIMVEEARSSAAPATTVVPVTGRFGTLYIENRVESAIASHAVLDAIAEHVRGCDAVVISAFGDPGVTAAKELMDIPVLGVSEAACLTAYALWRRYSMIYMTQRLRTWYMECAQEHGLAGRMASARALDVPIPDITRARETVKEPLLEQCLRAVDEDGAEVIIVAGGPAAGLAREIQDRIPVPTIDGVSCAVRLAEMLIGLNARPLTRGSFARPSYKPAKGLSPALMRQITDHNAKGMKDWYGQLGAALPWSLVVAPASERGRLSRSCAAEQTPSWTIRTRHRADADAGLQCDAGGRATVIQCRRDLLALATVDTKIEHAQRTRSHRCGPGGLH